MTARRESLLLFGALTGLTGLVTLLSLGIGTVFLAPHEIVALFWADDDKLMGVALREIRLPRTLAALLVGGTLGLTGAALQGYTRNPLADSGLLGVNGGAALGAVLVLYTGAFAAIPFALPLGGLAGALVATALIVALSGRANIQTLILAGVAVSSLAAALTSLVLNFAPNPYAALEIVHWLLGSVANRSWDDVGLVLPFMAAGAVLLLLSGPGLRALTLGEDTAASLGFSMRKLRWLIIAGAALAVGPATALAGAIGFVGLVVPHLLRPLVGHDPARLLPASALGGAVLLTAADIVIRLLPADRDLKLGVITALIGAPFFLFLILKVRKEWT